MLRRVFFSSEYEVVPETISGLSDLQALNGGYSAAFTGKGKTLLVRDVLGIIPLFFNGVSYSDESKHLDGTVMEVNPRQAWFVSQGKVAKQHLNFFRTCPVIHKSKAEIVAQLKKRLLIAISERLAGKRLGVLFSGGVDSSLIAFLLKSLGASVIGFSAGVALANPPEDLVFAKRAAHALGIELSTSLVPLTKVEALVKEIIPIIESRNVVKVGVALPLFVAAQAAKRQGITRIFSGLGSEEIFAGYQRHRQARFINRECKRGLMMMHHRDTYRDYTIARHLKLELMVPFLDRRVVEYSLRIPPEYKIVGSQLKVILREVAKDFGLPGFIYQRPKRAAQYGSGFDKALLKLARGKSLKKSQYLSAIGA